VLQLPIINHSRKNLVTSNDDIFITDNIKYWGNTDDWENLNMTSRVYVDMDGVIADFFSALAEFRKVNHWKDQGEITIDTSIKQLQGTNFFETLPVFPFAKKLVDLVKSYTGGDWYINTSPLRNDHENSEYYKTKWLKKHNFDPKDIIVTKRKESYAVDRETGIPNILIDDRPKNLERWVARGGVGIRYQANEDSLDLIKKGLDKAYGTIANVKGENTESMVTHGDRKSMPSENDRG
tara:strand:- start:1410 stop:2120 length:711 start_codon:yes stop_codon:yes gene_type:complete